MYADRSISPSHLSQGGKWYNVLEFSNTLLQILTVANVASMPAYPGFR